VQVGTQHAAFAEAHLGELLAFLEFEGACRLLPQFAVAVCEGAGLAEGAVPGFPVLAQLCLVLLDEIGLMLVSPQGRWKDHRQCKHLRLVDSEELQASRDHNLL